MVVRGQIMSYKLEEEFENQKASMLGDRSWKDSRILQGLRAGQ